MNILTKLAKRIRKNPLLLPCVVAVLAIGFIGDLSASQQEIEKVVEGTKNLFINNSTKTLAALGIAILGIVSFIQRRVAWAIVLFGVAAVVARIDVFVEFLKTISSSLGSFLISSESFFRM